MAHRPRNISGSSDFRESCVILTFTDVFPVDFDILVAVFSAVFVVETQRVQQFVLDDALMHAGKSLQ